MAWQTFLFLIVIIDPIALAPVFLKATRGSKSRNRDAIYASLFSFVLGVLAIWYGKKLQALIGISDSTLKIIGGALLLKTGLLLLLPHPEVPKKSFVPGWIYPIAFPLIIGPGAIIYLIARSGTDDINLSFGVFAACAATCVSLLFATRVTRSIPHRIIHWLEMAGAVVLIGIAAALILDGFQLTIF